MPKNALAPPSVNAMQPALDTPRNALARLYSAYQQYLGQPFAQTVRGGVRGYFGLPLMSDADATGREAYRQGEALGFTPGVGMPAGAVRVAAEGMQALPSIAGDIGRVIAGMPRSAARAQAEDFARYQRSIPPSDVSPLTAFHGTPHTFEPTPANPLGEFRASAIGSGEGAQAFGHGLYFAESPEVAKGYRAMLSQNKVLAVFRGNDGYYVKEGLGDTGKNVAGPFKTGAEAEQVRKSLPQPKGSLYTVDIPDSMVEKMLDWDKPLSQQPKSVQQFFEPLVAPIRKAEAQGSSPEWGDFAAPRDYDPLGSELMQLLGRSDQMNAASVLSGGTGGAASSAKLQAAGIPGIRYLDRSSRATGEGTRNIVVFPGEESKVKILKRD